MASDKMEISADTRWRGKHFFCLDYVVGPYRLMIASFYKRKKRPPFRSVTGLSRARSGN